MKGNKLGMRKIVNFCMLHHTIIA